MNWFGNHGITYIHTCFIGVKTMSSGATKGFQGFKRTGAKVLIKFLGAGTIHAQNKCPKFCHYMAPSKDPDRGGHLNQDR